MPAVAQRPTAEDRIRAATWFAERGFGIFSVWSTDADGACRCPKGKSCDNPGKHPITVNGFHDATTDPKRIRTFLSAASEPNYGLVCPEGVFALDVDGEGVARLAELERQYGPLPPTLRTSTAHGEHVFLRWPAGIPQPIGQLFGFVTRWGSGRNAGYVIGPRSVHASGTVYAPSGDAFEIAELPEAWARPAVSSRSTPVTSPTITVSAGYELPVSVPASVSRYEAILAYTAHLYNRGISPEEMWPLVRDLLAPRFEQPLAEPEVRSRFDRAVDKMPDRLGDPRAVPAVPTTLNVAPLTDFESTPIEWLWPAWLAKGVVTVLDGNPGVSKSTLMADLVARVTTGREWPDGSPAPGVGRTLWITTEDDPGRVLRPRIEVIGGNAALALFATSEVVFPDVAVAFRALLVELAGQSGGLSLVILDPLFSHIDAKVRSIADADMRRHVMNPLQRAAEAADVAIIVVRHFNKDTAASTLNRGAGSLGGIVGAARAVWTATVDREDASGETKVVGVTKLNYARPRMPLRYHVVSKAPPGWVGADTVPAIEWLGEATVSIDQLNSDDEFAGDAQEALEEILAAGPVAATGVSNLMKSRGFGRDATRRAAARLRVQKAKTGLNGGWEWSLADDRPDSSKDTDGTTLFEGSGADSSKSQADPSGPRVRAPAGRAPVPDSSDASKSRKNQVGDRPPRAPVREEAEDTPMAVDATPASHVLNCLDYDGHQFEYRNTPTGWMCLVCPPLETTP